MKWSLSVTIVAVALLGISEAMWAKGEEGYHYKLAVATVDTGPQGNQRLSLTVVKVYRQGEKLRVDAENGITWLSDGKQAIVFNRDARKGWFYSGLPDGMLLAKLGGHAALLGLMVVEKIAFPFQASSVEVVDETPCVVWSTDSLWGLVGVKDACGARMVLWVPRDTSSPPVGFRRIRLITDEGVLYEARLVTAEKMRLKADVFRVGKEVQLLPVRSRAELLRMVGINEVQGNTQP